MHKCRQWRQTKKHPKQNQATKNGCGSPHIQVHVKYKQKNRHTKRMLALPTSRFVPCKVGQTSAKQNQKKQTKGIEPKGNDVDGLWFPTLPTYIHIYKCHTLYMCHIKKYICIYMSH